MRIPMEDWLRGCVYHDGRHGEVTLPTDKVLEIANYIQITRTSQTDGCIELPPYTADTPQTDLAEDAPRLEVTKEEFEKIVERIKDAPLKIERLADCAWGEPE